MKPSTEAKLRERIERSVPLDEAEAYLSTPITDEERRDVLELVAWFRRRYPTPLDRLRYVDRAYRRWSRSHGRG